MALPPTPVTPTPVTPTPVTPTPEKSDVGLTDCISVWDKELDLVLVMVVAVVGGGVNDQQKFLDIMPFVKGKLPIRYLGVPLITKRLGVKDCKVLIDKIKVRVNNWKNKCLSYTGRLLLIAYILESIYVYWATVFLLPKTVIKDINKLLKGFLWCNGEMTRGKAKVAWKIICRLKDKGGLGLKVLDVWNKALLVKHI
ncbi:hypothetical protein Tco_0823545 [Tanacetum coccineum]|uniref:Uncharacterized protein n=1 Tax=Tanacetum coccineum TaxID=301880 RepID=A0ABQ5AI68_9ASTR